MPQRLQCAVNHFLGKVLHVIIAPKIKPLTLVDKKAVWREI